MKGYLLNFYKYSPIGKSTEEDDYFKNNLSSEEFVRSMIWSTFDRLEVREITEFSQYRMSEYSEKNWVGERQFSMIYEADNKDFPGRLKYTKRSDDKCLFAFDAQDENKANKLLFFGVSMVDLTPEAFDYFYSAESPGETIRKEFLQVTDQIVIDNAIDQDSICYDVYGTLGGNDLVIIWLANQFKDVVSVIEALRKSTIDKGSKKGVLANISTIMGLRNINQKDANFNEIEGNLNIRLTKKEGFDDKQFKEELSKYINIKGVDFETVLGEHDLSFSIPGKNLASGLYKEGGFIHIRNKIFANNFLQANTELSVAIDYENLKGHYFNIHSKLKTASVTPEERRKVLESINTIINGSVFIQAPYLRESLWILYEDYMKNISSVFTYPWTQDLQFYFKTSLEYLEKLIKVDTAVISNKLKYDCIDLLISSIRQMILHVAQSNRLFFEVPNIHLKHTGTYSKILRAYQGIIKYLLKLAYALPKFSNQSQIIPFINFDVTPIAKSEACPNIIISEDEDNRDKIITIKLPYEALVNIPKYTYLLAHEIYHYIAPEDRKRRNGLLGAVTITIIISQVSVMYIEKYIKERLDINSADISEDDWNKVFSIFKDEIEKNALRFTITEFDKIKGLVNGYKGDAEWGMYFSAIIRALGIGMHNCAQFVNQIYIFLLEMDYDSLIKAAKESQNDNVVKIVRFVIDALMMELENGFEEFYGWVKYFRPNDRITNEANHIQYALREALADYFMLQSIGLNLNAYLEEIMHYKDIISGKDDPRQMYRLGMVIDFVFPELLDAKKNKLADKMEALKSNLITHHSMEESVAESIAISYMFNTAVL